ncbi:MAG TPA: tripartite tricarboxylate transporter substrate binding protein [Burkholderiales bacterium]|nr:tripartite tricarboxylate transporter substrate binding protein [Burkholderiales bacterium]
MNFRRSVPVALSMLCLQAGLAAAQSFPSKPVRVIVPFAPGGATDVVFRLLAPKLSENLGQQAVVENRAGGGSTIGMDAVAKSAPDGYTLGVANLSFAVNPSLMAKLPYDTERDFAPVSLVTIVPLAISVHPSVPARSVKELIVLAKAKPGSLHYASSGNGSATHMATELFKFMTGTDIVHVPYNGGGPAVVAVVGGQVPIYTGSIPSQVQHVKSGKLVALAVTSSKPDPALPGIPTVAEAGVPGYEAVEWQGVVVPAGTPGPVIERLNRAIVQSVKAPDFNERLVGVGAHAVGSTAAEFADYLKKELATWSRVIKATGIKIE